MPVVDEIFVPPPNIGGIIKARREELRISQADLGWIARISRNTVSNVERGEGNPEDRTITDLLAALALNWHWPEMAKAALSDSRTAHMVQGDPSVLPELIDAPAARRLMAIIREIRATPLDLARKVADAYRSFLGMFVLAEIGREFLPPLPESVEDLPKRRFEELVEHIAPFIDETMPINTPLIEFFSRMPWPLPEGLPWGRDVALLSAEWPTTRRDLPTSPFEDPELDRLRDRLGVVQEQRENAELQLAELRRELEAVKMDADRARWQLAREARTIDLIEEVLSGPRDAIKVFGRLPEDVQDALRDSWVVDHTITDGIGGPGYRNIILTIRSNDAKMIPARFAAMVTNSMELLLDIAQSVARGPGNHYLGGVKISIDDDKVIHAMTTYPKGATAPLQIPEGDAPSGDEAAGEN